MNEVNSVSKSFSGCKKVSSSEVITARIRALMADDKRKSQVYVHVRQESRDFYFWGMLICKYDTHINRTI